MTALGSLAPIVSGWPSGVRRTDRDLQGDGVHVLVGQGVDARAVGAGDQLVARDRPQVTEVEDGAEVHEEAVGTLAGEDDLAVRRAPDGRSRKRLVVRRGPDAHVAGRAGEPGGRADDGAGALTGRHVGEDLGDGVRLAPIPRRAVARARRVGDRPGGVQERVGVEDRRGELELVGDGRDARSRVVDVDLVEDVVTHRGGRADHRLGPELEEVRPTIGILQRHVVGDDGDRVGGVRADERIDVRAVCGRIFGNGGCFFV